MIVRQKFADFAFRKSTKSWKVPKSPKVKLELSKFYIVLQSLTFELFELPKVLSAAVRVLRLENPIKRGICQKVQKKLESPRKVQKLSVV